MALFVIDLNLCKENYTSGAVFKDLHTTSKIWTDVSRAAMMQYRCIEKEDEQLSIILKLLN